MGTDGPAWKAVKLFNDNQEWGIQVIGCLTNDRDELNTRILDCPVLGMVDDLPRILESHVVDTIFYAGGTDSAAQIRNLANRCEMIGIDFVLDVSSLLTKTIGVSVEKLGDVSSILFKPISYKPEKLFLKRVRRFYGSHHSHHSLHAFLDHHTHPHQARFTGPCPFMSRTGWASTAAPSVCTNSAPWWWARRRCRTK